MSLLTEEQVMLRDSARGWVKANAPVSAFRRMRDSENPKSFDEATFKSIAEMGWTGVVIPEAYGGSEFGYRSIGVVLEELGRNVVAAPLIGSAVGAASALVLGGTEAQKKAWLPKIAEGTAIAALAIDEGPRYAPDKIALAAKKKGKGYTLSGSKTFVMEGMAADVFVVAARTSGKPGTEKGITLFLIPADATGLSRKGRSLIDSRGYADLTFEGVEVGADAVIGQADAGKALLDKVLDRATAAVAAEQMGLAQQAFDTTIEYMKTRVQFGQLIGSFQALQHRAAYLFTAMQLARPTVDEALQAIDEDRDEVPELVSLAKAAANDFINYATREMIQLHGGIGMTDAHDAGFYLKRARVLEAAFGSSAYHRERYAKIIGM
ncbi:acyl-CoA dehydrogenase [Bradyrhizobium sp. LHD-71]|uniref:acyl-CoA dehydrogenase family protein n=1 Tax=Bradyrhizobium sp. LHD-71 TaxID=3072141 RepID=UPI00280D9351|nr:acyl-CoA dehydrogenase [Bradyrhizobium sp. LHD-71]MDQ8726394.1 acyl-CoA dehydrogenase [Bradyrhizobium sp. LHD-71]